MLCAYCTQHRGLYSGVSYNNRGALRAGCAHWQAAEGRKQQAALREGTAALQLEAESVARSLKAVTTVSTPEPYTLKDVIPASTPWALQPGSCPCAQHLSSPVISRTSARVLHSDGFKAGLR